MDTGHVHTWDSQGMAVNYVKQNLQGYVGFTFFQLGESIHLDVLPACVPPAYVYISCAVGATNLDSETSKPIPSDTSSFNKVTPLNPFLNSSNN